MVFPISLLEFRKFPLFTPWMVFYFQSDCSLNGSRCVLRSPVTSLGKFTESWILSYNTVWYSVHTPSYFCKSSSFGVLKTEGTRKRILYTNSIRCCFVLLVNSFPHRTPLLCHWGRVLSLGSYVDSSSGLFVSRNSPTVVLPGILFHV